MLMFDIILTAVLFSFFVVPLTIGIYQDKKAKDHLNKTRCRIDKWVC